MLNVKYYLYYFETLHHPKPRQNSQLELAIVASASDLPQQMLYLSQTIASFTRPIK